MADASIQFLLENLSSLIKSEIGLILGVNDDINKLSSNLTTIQAVLQDAEDKQFEQKAVRDWLRKLNDLSYEIEDVLDECVTELAKLEFKNRISKSINNILYKRKIARRIKQLTAKLDDVDAEREKFHLQDTTVVLQSELPAAMRETGSMLNQAHHVFGREEERDTIIDILLEKVRDLHELSVLPIIGLGGLGKTTLAQLVFNDYRVTEHFDIKLWVCVSDAFDPKTLIKAMIASATQSGSTSDIEPLDALQHRLFKLLNQKRYLLVLDDVWNENQEKWFVLKNMLTCGSVGSSVIVTTRLKKVADIMATTSVHDLEGLSEENCWLLFKERAFGHEEGEHSQFEGIGRQIVKKCAGVPLAATTLGGLLRFQRRVDDWCRVEDSPIWSLPQEESSILPALRLSYNHLPVTHRHCFAYCAVFPKDSLMWKEELIRQWMAHGYISSDGTSDVEEIGDKIFNELVLRSLLIEGTTDYWGRISFQMHDLVHDLAQSIMENKVPGHQAKVDNTPMSTSSIRQVNLHMQYAAFPIRFISDMDLFSIFTQFNRLRSLDASSTGVRDVPPAIGKLKQLRYLNLSHNYELKILPEKLCGLWNLKILDLNGCRKLERLPKRMRELRKLRHLFLGGCESLSQMPPKIGELTSLKTLSIFIVGKERDDQIGELQRLDLGGKLRITHLERVQEKLFDANKPILAEEQNLRNLILEWESGDSSRCRDQSLDEKVLKVLQPHGNVATLEIVGFQGNNIPLWARSSTVEIKLVELRIRGCHNCSYLPQVVVELPHLKKLDLYDLLALEYIVEDEGCDLRSMKFPALEELELCKLENLKSLLKNERGEVFPKLQKLEIHSCSSLLLLPQMSSLEKLNIGDCCSLLSLPQLLSVVELRCQNKNFTSVGGNFPKLSSLIMYCDRVDVGVPKEFGTNLKSLEIWFADTGSLPEEGLQGLKSLQRLSICHGRLTSLPGRWLTHLTSLEHLRIEDCHELVEIAQEIKDLHDLKELKLENLPKMVSLPNGLQHCTALQSLYLRNLEQMASLPNWLGNFTSLHSLEIYICPKLVSLPSSIQQMQQIQSLVIQGCPELQKQCEKGKGVGWHKISHIPEIYID